MNDKQKAIVGSLDYAFSLLPSTLEVTFKNNLDHSIFQREKVEVSIDNLSKMGKFWKFIKGSTELKVVNDTLTINQQNKEDNSRSLLILLNGVDYVEATFNNGNKKKCEFVKSIFKEIGVAYIDFAFSNPITSISLHVRYDLAENIVIAVNSVLFKEPTINISEERLKKLNCKVSTGESLINVVFQPCCDEYAKSTVSLYGSDKQFMGKMNVNEGMFFHSITGLAYGKYFIVLEQFDKLNNSLIKTTYLEVILSKPNYGGKPTISW